MFELHPVLDKDTILVKDLGLCRVLLMNNSIYPWLVLVPTKANLVEIVDLSDKDQIDLMKEISLVSKAMQNIFSPDKLNIAALGNVVDQLHIHIIARYKDDLTFPQPVWVGSENESYDDEVADELIAKIQKAL